MNIGFALPTSAFQKQWIESSAELFEEVIKTESSHLESALLRLRHFKKTTNRIFFSRSDVLKMNENEIESRVLVEC